MAGLINEDYLREVFNIHKDVNDKRIRPYLATASRRLKKWVGETRYAAPDLKTELELAEATLAMHYLQLNLNTAIRPEGLVKSERVEGDVTIQFFSPGETQTFASMYLEQAEEIVREITGESEPDDGIELIAETVCTDTGDTWGEWQT